MANKEIEISKAMYNLVKSAPDEVLAAAYLSAVTALARIARGDLDISDMPEDPNKISQHILAAVTDGLLEKMVAEKAASDEAGKIIKRMMN